MHTLTVSPEIQAQAAEKQSRIERLGYLAYALIRDAATDPDATGQEKHDAVREAIKARLFGGRSDDEMRQWLDDEVFVLSGWKERATDLLIRFAPEIVDGILDVGIKLGYRVLKLAGVPL